MVIREDKTWYDWLITILAVAMALWHLDLALFGGYENTVKNDHLSTRHVTSILVFRDREEKGWRLVWSVTLWVLVITALLSSL